MPNGVSLYAPTTSFPEVRGRSPVVAFLLGMAIVASPVILGHSYAFFVGFLVFSILITWRWRRSALPWIFLVSISAATPIAVSREQFACNTIFALWFTAFFGRRYLSKLPKWIYLVLGLAVFGVLTSAMNWMSGDPTRTILQQMMRQGALGFNFILGPFLLLPIVYLRMRGNGDSTSKLQGLLFCLILPSTLIFLAAKLRGIVINEWEASLHVESLSEGFLQYQLGKVAVNFARTEVGFIFAALICASAAITISRVKTLHRLLAGVCLVSNTYLLLITASIGSALACLCGLAAIFYAQARKGNVMRVAVSVIALACVLVLTYGLSPSNVKEYLGKRYEHRVTEANTDRLQLWERGAEQLLEHPEGIGFTLAAGDKVKTFVHNDYLAYFVSYGFFGGLAYTFLVVGILVSFFKRIKSVSREPAELSVYLAGLGVIVTLP